MRTLNNWITSNFYEIAHGSSNKLLVEFNPYNFKPLPFHEAALYTARLIQDRYTELPMYLGLTGGADSEYIARLFCKHKIPFTPIVVNSGAVDDDVHFARLLCDELDLRPVVISCNQYQLLEYYKQNVFPANSDGLTHCHQLLAADAAQQLGGVCVFGETHLFDPDPSRAIVKAFKFLHDIRRPLTIPFYYYTLELTYAEMKEVRAGESAQEFKARVRGTTFRAQKIQPIYSNDVIRQYDACVRLLHTDVLMHNMGTPQTFIQEMETFIQ